MKFRIVKFAGVTSAWVCRMNSRSLRTSIRAIQPSTSGSPAANGSDLIVSMV